ncbi:MAG: hypothetical protein QOH96_2679 [Blastocatellia bacterium]|nr:hypothetical protein [Blastocatellia bacterium]
MLKILRSTPAMVFLTLFSIAITQPNFAQTPKPPTARISGRVLVDGKPAPDVAVVLYPQDDFRSRSVAQTATDADGRYTFLRLAQGRFRVSVAAPIFANTESSSNVYGQQGKVVLLGEGESVSDIDFGLVAGAVITGRVTDAEGRPVIGLPIAISGSDSKTPYQQAAGNDPYMFQTDDRGIYRVYGIPFGKYIVSAGQRGSGAIITLGGANAPATTYHPNVTDRARAEVIDLSTGGEATGVDIQLGAPGRSFSASGRFVDADTGQPVSGSTVRYLTFRQERSTSNSWDNGTTDVKGQFKFDGLSPGEYGVVSENNSGPQSSTYSDLTRFQIVDADVTDIEVKVHQGSTLTGQVVFENSADVNVSTLFKSMIVSAVPQKPGEASQNQFRYSRVNSDGSFVLNGLRPGEAILNVGINPPFSGPEILRVEREGVLLPKRTVGVNAGEAINGLRIVVSVGTGSVRGTMTVGGQPLPPGFYTNVQCRRLATQSTVNTGSSGMTDARGHFLITGLSSGEYEIIANAGSMSPQSQPQPRLQAKQVVSVGESGESQIVLDLKPLERRGAN